MVLEMAATIEIPLTERCRKYGYVYWTKELDSTVTKFFAGKKRVTVVLDQYLLGDKKIDLKFRRISIGAVRAQGISKECDTFRLSLEKDGKLRVECLECL